MDSETEGATDPVPHVLRPLRCARATCVVAFAVVVGCSEGAGDDARSGSRGSVATSTADPGDAGRDGTSTPSGTSAPAEVQTIAADAPGFYDVPQPIPGRHHGDLVRVQPIEGAPAGVRWERIMYRSETLEGRADGGHRGPRAP